VFPHSSMLFINAARIADFSPSAKRIRN